VPTKTKIGSVYKKLICFYCHQHSWIAPYNG